LDADDYGGSITTYMEESKKIEKLENVSSNTISNTLNLKSNHNINNETSKELFATEKGIILIIKRIL